LLITSDDTLTLQGGISADVQVDFKEDDTDLNYLAFSGQAFDDSRLGFRYDSSKNWLSAFSRYEDVCHDAPGPEFLTDILAHSPASSAPTAKKQDLLSHFLPPLYDVR
jgi:hypothetical protein